MSLRLVGILPALLWVVFGGCASGLDGARQSLTVSARLLDASAQSFELADPEIQRAIAAKYLTVAEKEQHVQAYRAQRAAINKAFADADAALPVALATVALVEAGKKSPAELSAILSKTWDLLTAVQSALAAIGAFPPGWKPLTLPSKPTTRTLEHGASMGVS